MKKLNIYRIGAIVVFIIGMGFSYLVAESDDAPGVIIFGFAFSMFCFLILFGLGTLIDEIKNNNKIIIDIYMNKK